MFASKSVVAHLVRGIIAAVLILWALDLLSTEPVFALAAGASPVSDKPAEGGSMRIGMVGLGRMGGNMVRRLLANGRQPRGRDARPLLRR
jgi:hypothetical protein